LFLSIWALPVNLFAFAGAGAWRLFGQIQYHGIYRNDQLPYAWAVWFIICPGSWTEKYFKKQPLNDGYQAVTSGNVIISLATLPPERANAIMLHELRHVWQTMTWSIFQPILYSVISFDLKRRHGKQLGYLINPFEQDAYNFAGENELRKRLISEL